jgi:hypothetical protein
VVAGLLTISVEGATEAEEFFEALERRIMDLTPAFERTLTELEQREKAIFDGWAGKYVRTGRTRASLTERGRDALRAAHAQEAEFGTAVPYAAFFKREVIVPAAELGALLEANVSSHLVP